MLSSLHIENIAVIERADIGFDRGFNVLTGETGAGKSIVIDAISAILGERTYRDVIRTGSEKAFVSAVFENVPALSWFEENHVPYEEELLISREITVDGKNTCRVNSQPVSVSVLRQLGMQLINIHGQHDSQQLFDEQTHIRFLDAFASDSDVLADYQAAYREVLRVREEIERLSMDESEKQRRMEMLRYQIAELERAELTAGEDEALESKRKLLQNSEKLMNGLMDAYTALYGDEDSNGATAMAEDAQYALSRIAKYDERLESLYALVKDLSFRISDCAEQLRDFKDEFAYSEEDLESIESRLDTLHKLKRKYGATCADMLDFLENAKQELSQIEFADEHKQELEAELAKAEKIAYEKAQKLHSLRIDAAQELEERILTELEQLDMPKVQFSVQFSECALCTQGIDEVRFLMSANVGEALKPMSKVASGGELARIMLAMKNVLAEQDAVTTLIFDEVDAGVSGRAAQKVAEKLHRLAESKQVLCVTHLPQIAAMADCHILISKAAHDGRTFTSVTTLDFEGRTNEIARIIGGASITETTRRSAAEMLKH